MGCWYALGVLSMLRRESAPLNTASPTTFTSAIPLPRFSMSSILRSKNCQVAKWSLLWSVSMKSSVLAYALLKSTLLE